MKFEYDITILQGSSTQVRAALNEKGAQGWENYSIVGSTAYFRREVSVMASSAAPGKPLRKSAGQPQ